MSLRIPLAIAMLIAATGVARADAVRVFPLSGAPEQLTGAKLTTTLSDAIHAKVANVPLEDAAGLLECLPKNDACLVSVAKSLQADRLVFGTIEPGDDDNALRVTLTRFDVAGNKREQHTFEISGDTPDELGDNLVAAAGPMFGLARQDPIVIEEDDHPPPPETPGAHEGGGKISTATYVIGGAGLAAVGAGVGFLLSAQSLRTTIDNAPTATVQDLQHLKELEDAGVLRTRIGDVLVVAGGVALAYGVVRGVMEKRSSESRPGSLSIQPVPIDGGAAIVVTVLR